MKDDSRSAAPPGATRAYLRVPIDVFVRVVGADRDYPFRTRDVSEGGIFLNTRVGHLYPFNLGDELTIELHDDTAVVTLDGAIVRVDRDGTEGQAGFAIRLHGLGDTQRAALRTLLLRHRSA